MSDQQFVHIDDIIEKERKLGFESVERHNGATYRDCSTVVIVPTRGDGLVHYKVVEAWENMISPMNQKRAKRYAVGHEVGKAYTDTIKHQVLANPVLSKFKYILTLEDDNTPPADAHLRLLESIEAGPFAAVSGIYFTKGYLNMPMAYGDPAEFKRTGVLDFRPRDTTVNRTGNIMEVNGIGMGCALWRMELFRKFEPPWFVTLQEVIPEKGVISMTQDLYFCQRLRQANERLAVDLRVRVGHIDRDTGDLY